MSDYADRIIDLVERAVPGVPVYDGMPPEALEDRPALHVIVDIFPPEVVDDTVALGATLEETVRFQVRVIARTGLTISREDAAWSARWHSGSVRRHLIRETLAPSKGRILQESAAAFTEDQALVAHAYRIEATAYVARI